MAAADEDRTESAVALLRAGSQADHLFEVCLRCGEVAVRQGGLAGAVGGVGLAKGRRDVLGESGAGEQRKGDAGYDSRKAAQLGKDAKHLVHLVSWLRCCLI